MENLSYWNYRMVINRNHEYEVREVYYDKDNKPISWIDPTPVTGDSVEDIEGDLKFRMKALSRPVLIETDAGLIEFKGNY